MLEVKDIQVYYGAIHAIKGVSFEVNEGEIVTLIGANGAGKTTTLEHHCGTSPQPRPATSFFRARALRTSAAPQDRQGRSGARARRDGVSSLQMTVEENLEMGAFTRANSTVEPGLEKVYELFPRLKERRRQVAGTLSGGEQQMLAMGRALMSAPKLMMLDEPSMGLAPILVEQVFDIIQSLHKARNDHPAR